MAWNISKAKRRALVALQLRDKNGRFIDMGKSVKWYSSKHKSEVTGTVEDGEGTRAIVRMSTGPEKGRLVHVEANQIEVIESKATLNPEAAPKADAPSAPEAKLPNPKDDPDYEATKAKYALPETAFKPIISKTSDGNTYFSAPEGAELYTPAKELAVGDEVIAPDGADPQKPFSMGKGWAYKKAERVAKEGPQIGKVISIKEHAYAVVQLPDGFTADSVKNPGEKVNTVTIGLSNKVIKATPELKAALADVIPEPVYGDSNAPVVDEAAAKNAKKLDMLQKAPAGSTVSAKDGSVVFTKFPEGDWGSTDGSMKTPAEILAHVDEVNKQQPAGSPSAFTIEMDTATPDMGEASADPIDNQTLLAGMYEGFAAELAKAPLTDYALSGKDEAFGAFDGFNEVESEAVTEYVGSSIMVNSALRNGKVEDPQIAAQILGMDSILDRSVLLEDAKVYRGIGASAGMLDSILKKGVFNDRAFSSTSVDQKLADSWVANTGSSGIVPVVMEIDLPKGFKAHKVDYDLVGSGFDHENEVVLPRGLDFDIVEVQEYTNEVGQKGYRVKATPILNDKNYKAGETNDTANPGNGADSGPAGGDSSGGPAPAGDGTDSEQGGQVRVDGGSGDIPDTGGSPEASPAESGDQDADGPLIEDAPKGARRDRSTIMAELQPLDTSNWEKVGAQAGSNPGGVFEDETGKQWYVKQSKSDAHARAEVLADQLYKASGIDSAGVKLTTFNGKMGTASPMIEGAKGDLYNKYSDKAYMDKIREGFAVDAWLANWDVLGLEDDNIITNAEGNPVRIDTGGTLMFRAQGGLKNSQQPGAWGNEVKDWDGLRSIGTAQKAFKGMSDQQMVDSAARVEAVTPEEIDAMVDALGYTGGDALHVANILKARREDIIKKAAALGVSATAKDVPENQSSEADAPVPAPKLVEPTDAPAADNEPFEPVLPSQQKAQEKAKPKYPKATKENPNVLQGYTIEKNADGVYFPKERLDMDAWNGLRKGTIVPPSLPFIPFPTDSGEVHYWDTKGNKHWGQFGGAGALTRRKNSDGEYEYLLAQRASSLSTEPNMWSTPGGAHTSKEDSEGNGVTAKIELEEELGMVVHGEPVANYKHSTAPDWSYDYSIFDAPSDGEPDMEAVDKREIQDLKWMTAEEISALKDDGTLHPAMAEVLDDLLAASESVQTDADEASTPESDSDAPVAPSEAVDEPSSASEEAPVPVEDPAAKESAPEVDTSGPSATMADGKQAYVGSRVVHKKLGAGTVIQIIAGKSAKVEYDDGTVKIAQAHLINSFEGKPVANAPVDTSGMKPGEVGNNPANGKLFIVDADNKALYVGDKVEATHQGETKTGVVKGIYTTVNSVAIIFDGDKKPITKKAATSKSLEEQPEAPVAAPEDAPEVPAAQDDKFEGFNEDGYNYDEAKAVEYLEQELAAAYKGGPGNIEAIEQALDYLYAKGEARLAGEPEPEVVPELEERIADPESVNAPESAPEAEDAPEAPAEPETAPEEAPEAPEEVSEAPEEAPEAVEVPSEVADEDLDGETEEEISSLQMWELIDKILPESNEAPDGSVLTSAKLGQTWTKNGYKWSNDEGDEYYIDTIIGGSENALDWVISEPTAAKPLTALDAPDGSTLNTGDGSLFTKNLDGDWDLSINGKKFGIKATDEQIDEMSNRLGIDIQSSDTSDADAALESLKKRLAGIEPEPELAEWEKELLGAWEADQAEKAAKGEPEDDVEQLADWEKELLGYPVEEKEAPAPVPVSKNNFEESTGDLVSQPTGEQLDNMNAGTKLVTSDDDQYVYTKISPSGSIESVWEDQWDNVFVSDELANGSDVKIESYGTPPETPVADELDEFSDTFNKVFAFPIGTKLGNPEGEHMRKTDENEWSSFFGNEFISDDEAMSDQDVAKFALEYPEEYGLQTAKQPNDTIDESSSADLMQMSVMAIKLFEMPEGTMIGDPESGNYIKQDGKWVGYLDKTKVDWEPEYTDQQMAQIVFHNQNIFDIDNPILPKVDNGPIDDIVIPDIYNLPAAEPEVPKKSLAQVQNDLAKLPQGTKIGDPNGEQWGKAGPDQWTNFFEGEAMGPSGGIYTDAEMAELVSGLPEKYGEQTFALPEGTTVEEEPTPVGTLGGLSKEAFAKKPVGTKVVYSNTGKASEPTGVYEKTGPSAWSYTKEGADTPSKENLDGSIFDHLFSADVDNSKYSIDSKRSVAATDEVPEDTSGVIKEFDLSNATAALDSFPVGTTIKKNQPNSNYYPNMVYYVKQEDGMWQEYKKTPSKTMKGSQWASSTMSAYGGLSTISKPMTANHAVLATGEIAYVGDTVLDGPDSYTIEGILKSGINVVGTDGVKKKLKPHALKKDSQFGVGPSHKNSGGHSNGMDPLSNSAEGYAKVQHAKLVAKQEADKLKQALENFGGGTADEYDAQGLTMPSNPSPMVDNGLTVLDLGEPDKDNPLYGTAKPVKPSDASNYPPFNPPTADPLPKWDSESWLKKVEQRYLDNPNKAKATVQQSNKWSAIQSVLTGDKSQLDNLVGSMYLDDDLRKEAIEGIDAQEKANSPLKKKIVDDAKAAKEAYDTKKAEDLKDLNAALEKYHKDLDEWVKANPSPDAYKKAKKPPFSTQAFEGGEADWTKGPVGTYTAKSVMDAMREDNVLGAHGLSIATDSDQIEDLDVKVTKVLDKNGDPKFEFKFKLTAPHGAVFESALKADDKVIHDTAGIYPSNMVKDASTGLFKDAGKPSSEFINKGVRYSYTDQMTGAKIVFQRAEKNAGLNVSSNNNTVKIHMPVDSTPEQYQQTLENLGIKKARPSTAGDLRVLAENKLIYLMGTSKNGVDVIDGTVNMTGEDRKKTLQEIKDTYGVTPDDMTFSAEPNGRVRFFLNDEKASEFAKKYNVGHFYHDVKGGFESSERWITMLAGKNPGMLSTYHRFTEGINKGGISSWQDMSNGAGDYNYVTPKAPNADIHSVGIFIKPTSIFKRTDFWANPGDGWGKKTKDSGEPQSNKSPYKLFDSKVNKGTTGIGYEYGNNSVYEVLPKDSIPLSDWSHVTVPTNFHQEIIDALIAKGITEINGMPLDKFILKPGQTPPTDLTVAG